MTSATNIIAAFFDTAGKLKDAPCARYKKDDVWCVLSFSEVARQVKTLALRLKDMGVGHGDRVAICGQTSVEWTIADLAIMAAGGITVPVYPTLSAANIRSIVRDAKPQVVFMDEELKDVLQTGLQTFNLKVISLGQTVFPDDPNLFYETSIREDLSKIDESISAISPGDVSTIVYTSGTTGEQKGVVITHENIFTEVSEMKKIFVFGQSEVGLMFLPLSHVLGRLIQFYQLVQGCQAAYATSLEKLGSDYLEVRPHFVCTVPRALEKIYELVELHLQNSSFAKRLVFKWAICVGRKRSLKLERNKQPGLYLRLKFKIADILVFGKIRKKLGGRLKCFVCGGAHLKESIARFFHSAQILVLEGYGLTETFAAASVNHFDDYRFGTVGKVIDCMQFKFADDGEILFRGPTVFKEYRNRISDTIDAFDEEGWFKTGDLGVLVEGRFLKIIGRKKEIIVTSGGKNVAPQMIETIMSSSPLIDHFMVYGDGRKYLVGIVAINKVLIEEYFKDLGITLTSPYSQDPQVQYFIETHVAKQNKQLSSYETIKKFIIAPDTFTIKGGELTPTLKIKRPFVIEKYKEQLEGMYTTREA